MKVISWNVNGLRSVVRKGFLDFIRKESPDILCLQEIKIRESEIPFDLKLLDSYQSYFSSAYKRGYAGVGVYSKKKALNVKDSLGMEQFDKEGRFLELEFPKFNLINVYIPHGVRDKSKLPYKTEVYRHLREYLRGEKEGGKEMILAGDFNIAHTELDLARPRENRENIMFSSVERIQLDELIKLGFIDTFRRFHQEAGNYSWWGYYKDVRERNIGWRIDYIFVSDNLKPKLKDAFILSNITGSDHAPIGVEFINGFSF